MIKKILIANRGEIACRVIKTARKLGIATVAVYSDADAKALHVTMADEAVHIGPAPSKDSYLKADNILKVAQTLNVDAIHPGYGFLSENADFARACADKNITFIGPGPDAIAAMGSKSAAKHIMEEAGVPLVPGYHGDDQSVETLKQHADDMGYPVLLKAAAGGGGKGMRQVWKAQEFDSALQAAKREAMASFSDDVMLIEKYLTKPRHVEIQVFCDTHGNGVYLFERDCSVQRRHQKIIEEAPAPGMSESIRRQMGEAAIKAAQAINYVGAGTVEFLLDGDDFYFMEMNTRLQVEHPVTEKITGEDLVDWQIQVANGHPLPKTQDELKLYGHAFEARLYAEDPENGFLPATGKLTLLQPPAESKHVRVDTGVVQGDDVSVYYDPMIAKLIVWDENRERALQRLLAALRDYHVAGVTTNLEFLYNVAASEPFQKAELLTTFVEKHESLLLNSPKQVNDQMLAAAAMLILLSGQQSQSQHKNDPDSPWSMSLAWRPNFRYQQTLSFCVGEKELDVVVTHTGTAQRTNQWTMRIGDNTYQVSGQIDGHVLQAQIDGYHQRIGWAADDVRYTLFSAAGAVHLDYQKPDMGDVGDTAHDGGFAAPMNGTIVEVSVSEGEAVKKGATLLVMEAMKMEHNITAPSDGTVKAIYYASGDLVDGGAQLLEFEADE
ncbi:acetyl/propionyl/methylcrotonyl-CoA carboxylase subunit alpha [Salinimonas sp. HHU 13199]|uniref:Acetyl/propionyl/methylcrotonyl-CoA carboxylase subunit alpha n=1 Tax=Salinimonas profundi TaxID=2729140 RepID=A0ABR8LKJ9_9ALTE|nr:acetyl/propionyl/methylcrotonyl-CoA carboxylase subunit alpha [Salinimonas profundi]MBD3584832.1 acetyl/propionyl/methylcrotonyl-CoA carboxylase subunit alpha [Salinimonas profundi]